MKLKILWISILIIVFSFPSICFSERPDPKVWEYVGNNRYYNVTNLIKSSNIVYVWTYSVVDDDFRKKTIEEVKKEDLEKTIKFQNYDHIVSLNEIDCETKLTRINEVLDYDNKGNVLDHFKDNNSKWRSIQPGTVNDIFYQKLCFTPKKPSEKK